MLYGVRAEIYLCFLADISDDLVDRVAEYKNLPFLNITSPISNIRHLVNSDIDRHLPNENIFGYHTTHDFHSSSDIIDCSALRKLFSALHCNIRSLSANYDNLNHMLSELDHSFSLIGLTEIKSRVDRDIIANIDMPGYDFVSIPSQSNAGGVAFYIKNNLEYSMRPEFTINTPDFEALWLEMYVIGQPNLFCGIIYRHPESNLEHFMDYINSTIESIHQKRNSVYSWEISVLTS